ncbi:hypothetical protein D3C84_800420 [compost metagenome]
MLAVAAIGRQAGHHMIARLDRTHFAAHLLDDAGRFMTEHHRHRVRIGAIDKVQVGVANAHRNGAHQHFPWAGLADTDLFDDQWRTGGM